MAEVELPVVPNVKVKHADYAWAAIAIFVAGYDFWAIREGHETLSRAYWRALKRPSTRWPAIVVTTMLYKHLLFPNFLPQLDPLNQVAERWHEDSRARRNR